MTRKVYDTDMWLPGIVTPADPIDVPMGPASPHRLPPLPGYGFANYDTVFKKLPGGELAAKSPVRPPMEEYLKSSDALVETMDSHGMEVGGLYTLPNDVMVELVRRHPGRFHAFAHLSPFDGMRAVRELERLVREEHFRGLSVLSLYDQVPANDRRYYPLYAKCVELDVPVRIYCGMTYANDRSYQLGHPANVDQVAVDFPELTIVARLGGWPWVSEMMALVRRHPRLFVDTAMHRPRHFVKPGSGWESLLFYGSNVLQDKVMVGLSSGAFGMTMDAVLREYEELPLPERVLDKWLHTNATRVFNL